MKRRLQPRPSERGFRHRWLRATRCRRSAKRRPQRWYRLALLRRVGESRDWGPDLSTEACSRADLLPLLDESAWRSGVASPRRPVRRHISRGPVPRSQTSVSPPHSGTLSQLPRGVPRSGESATASFWITPAYTREPPLCRAPLPQSTRILHVCTLGREDASVPRHRSGPLAPRAPCDSARSASRRSGPSMTWMPAQLAEHHTAASASVRAGRWTKDRAAWGHRPPIWPILSPFATALLP